MRLLITLTANQNASYTTDFHHKQRGRIGKAFTDTKYEEAHGTPEPNPMCMSNIYPWQSIVEGNEYNLIVASLDEGLLATLAEHLIDNPEFNVGDMSFTVTDLTEVNVDVGEPGTRGVLETATGVLVRIPRRDFDKYPINTDTNRDFVCWEPSFTLRPFIEHVSNNADWKHNHFYPELPGAEAFESPLFQEYNFIKDYWVNLEVTTGVTVPYKVSKWQFVYEVENDHHRRHLNLLLDVGVGERNGMGLGFLNPRTIEETIGQEPVEVLAE